MARSDRLIAKERRLLGTLEESLALVNGVDAAAGTVRQARAGLNRRKGRGLADFL